MENKEILKFENYYGQKVDYSFLNELIPFSIQEESQIKEETILSCWKNNTKICIKEEISSSGGQGTVYMSNIDGVVIKIYNPEYRTVYIEKKLQKMVKTNMNNNKICWPLDVVYFNNKFVGFTMKFVQGKTLYSLTTNASRVMRKYPSYSKIKQIEMIIEILEQFDLLHESNILVGDVKLENIMFDDNFHITLIDMDSIQIGEFNCETSTPGYDPPEIITSIGVNNITNKLPNGTYSFNQYYKTYYRTPENEHYTLAILLYRILMNGQFPYSYIDWGINYNDNNQDVDVELCVKKSFAYGLSYNDTNRFCSEPQIWSHLPSFIKKSFVNCFVKNIRYSAKQWLNMFKYYLQLIKDKQIPSDEYNSVFPQNEIDYDKVIFNYEKDYISKGFTMAHTVARLVRQSKSETLKNNLQVITQTLKYQPQCVINGYCFNLIYNIGILKKVRLTEFI